MAVTADWLAIERGDAPLLVSVPHAGTQLPGPLAPPFVSGWLARRDADWYVDRLYGFVSRLGATRVSTAISRSVIDVNRDPSGRSLYPGMATTELCPTTTFDGEPLHRDGEAPMPDEIARRRDAYFTPYHAALRAELDRLRARNPVVVLLDGHSIRSQVPRLFAGRLPAFNVGTNSGASCAPALTRAFERIVAATGHDWVIDGRFKGGWITRRYGEPARGVHAIQLELAMRLYLDEPSQPTPDAWPPPWSAARAAALTATLESLAAAAIDFASHAAS